MFSKHGPGTKQELKGHPGTNPETNKYQELTQQPKPKSATTSSS